MRDPGIQVYSIALAADVHRPAAHRAHYDHVAVVLAGVGRTGQRVCGSAASGDDSFVRGSALDAVIDATEREEKLRFQVRGG